MQIEAVDCVCSPAMNELTTTAAAATGKADSAPTTSSPTPDTWATTASRLHSTTASDSFLGDHDVLSVHISFAAITLLYIPFILVNNNLVLWSTILFRKLHTPNNLMLASLAVADLIMGVYCIPMYALSYIPSTQHLVKSSGKYACLSWFASIELGGAGSLKNLLLITLDRFIAVEFPLSYNKIMTMKRTIIILTVLWLYVIVMTIVPFLGWNRYDPTLTDPNKRCNYYLTLPEGYVIWASFFTIAICISIPLFLNIKIFYTVCRQQRSMKMYQHLWSAKQIKRLRDRVQTVRITGILCLLFILFWLPYVLVAPLKYTKLSPRDVEIIKVVFQLLYFLNSVVNAPVYALVRTEYKIAYYLLLTTPMWKWGSLRRHCLSPDTPQTKPNKRGDDEDAVVDDTFHTPVDINPSVNHHPLGLTGVKSTSELTSNTEGMYSISMNVIPSSGCYINNLMAGSEVEETTLTVIPPKDAQLTNKSPDIWGLKEISSVKLSADDKEPFVGDNLKTDSTSKPGQHQTTATTAAETTTTTTLDNKSDTRRPVEKDGIKLTVHNARRYIRSCNGKISPLTPEPQDDPLNGKVFDTKGDISLQVDDYSHHNEATNQNGGHQSQFQCETADNNQTSQHTIQQNSITNDQPPIAPDEVGTLSTGHYSVRL